MTRKQLSDLLEEDLKDRNTLHHRLWMRKKRAMEKAWKEAVKRLLATGDIFEAAEEAFYFGLKILFKEGDRNERFRPAAEGAVLRASFNC